MYNSLNRLKAKQSRSNDLSGCTKPRPNLLSWNRNGNSPRIHLFVQTCYAYKTGDAYSSYHCRSHVLNCYDIFLALFSVSTHISDILHIIVTGPEMGFSRRNTSTSISSAP